MISSYPILKAAASPFTAPPAARKQKSLYWISSVTAPPSAATISSLGLPDALRAQGNPVYFHWDVKPEERAEIFEKAKAADWYLCSTNAITMNAKLINIDGNGNRVAAMFGGPKKVVLVVGKNKLAANLESGMARVKAVACSKNAQRFGLDTPCAITGKCVDCHHAQRICSVTTIIEQRPRLLDELHIVLVDEELGY